MIRLPEIHRDGGPSQQIIPLLNIWAQKRAVHAIGRYHKCNVEQPILGRSYHSKMSLLLTSRVTSSLRECQKIERMKQKSEKESPTNPANRASPQLLPRLNASLSGELQRFPLHRLGQGILKFNEAEVSAEFLLSTTDAFSIRNGHPISCTTSESNGEGFLALGARDQKSNDKLATGVVPRNQGLRINILHVACCNFLWYTA